MSRPANLLSLIGFRSDAALPDVYRTLFDESLAPTGSHLRWSFDPEMGFPRGGFRLFTGDGQSTMVPIVDLPFFDDAGRWIPAFSRLSFVARAAAYQREAAQIDHFLGDLFSDPALPQYQRVLPDVRAAEGSKVVVRTLDFMLAAATDPYIARLCNLYFLDAAAESPRNYYRIAGYWGTQEWPLLTYDFNAVQPFGQLTDPLTLGPVTIHPLLRAVQVIDPQDDIYIDHYLQISGTAPRGVRFVLEQPVEHFELIFRIPVPAESIWRLSFDGEEVRLSPEREDGVLVALRFSRAGRPFQRIELIDAEGFEGSWDVRQFRLRRCVGPIGEVLSDWFFFQYGISDSPEALAVPPPVITELQAEAAPLVLDGSGRVPPPNALVNLTTVVPAANDHPHRPVRLLFGRTDHPGASVPELIFNQDANGQATSLYFDGGDINFPALCAFFRLDGSPWNLADGNMAEVIGTGRFIQDRPEPEELPRQVLALWGNGALHLSESLVPSDFGESFTFHCRLWIEAEAPGATLFSNGADGLQIRLLAAPDGYRLRVLLRSRAVDSDRSLLLPEVWYSLGITYQPGRLIVYINGYPVFISSDMAAPAGFLPGGWWIGAEAGAGGTGIRGGINGRICDLIFWRGVSNPAQVYYRVVRQIALLPQKRIMPSLNFPGVHEVSAGAPLHQVADVPELELPQSQFSIHLWVYPEGRGQHYPTLLGKVYRESFWLGLHVGTYQPRFWINGQVFLAADGIPADSWTAVGVTYDGHEVVFYINGRENARHRARLGPMQVSDRPLTLGADATSSESRRDYPLEGKLGDVRLWNITLSPEEYLRRKSVIHGIDRAVPDGRYRYFARGIDLFGRISRWSSGKALEVETLPAYNAPVNVGAEFVPLRGTVTERPAATTGPVVSDLVMPDLPGLPGALISNVAEFSLDARRTFPDPDNPEDMLSERQAFRQEYEMEAVELVRSEEDRDQRLLRINRLRPVPLPQFRLRRNVEVKIELDVQLDLKWAWTGTQLLFYPGVNRFHLYYHEGAMNEREWPITTVAAIEETLFGLRFGSGSVDTARLAGKTVSVGAHLYTAETPPSGSTHTLALRYHGRPVLAPQAGQRLSLSMTEDWPGYTDYRRRASWRSMAIDFPLERRLIFTIEEANVRVRTWAPGTLPELQDRFRKPVDWLPDSVIYQIDFRRAGRPDDWPAEYIRPAAADYVPGVVVAFNEEAAGEDADNPGAYQDYYMLWHEWRGSTLRAYVLPHEIDEVAPRFRPSDERPAYLYAGQHFEEQVTLPELPRYEAGRGTRPYQFMLTAGDGRYQSDPSRHAQVVAVDRRRPAPPPAPEVVSVAPADYHGLSAVELRWMPSAGANHYRLYRASATDIFVRDLEMRRKRIGAYKGRNARQILADDPDFNVWFSAIKQRIPDFSAYRRADLFAEYPPESEDDRHITRLWRAWAERFYPTLDETDLRMLASRAGNDLAFTLVSDEVISGTTYTDRVKGGLNIKYFYRLRAHSASLQASSNTFPEDPAFSPVSNAAVPPPAKVKPPRKPVLTKVEAGDRQVTLQWSLNREPDLAAYLIYRGESEAAVADLRWWEVRPDPRIVGMARDPRVKVSDGRVQLPGSLGIRRIRAVYRTEEFDFSAEAALFPQNQAMNYWRRDSRLLRAETDTDSHLLENMRAIPDGTAVVIIYLNTDRALSSYFIQPNTVPFIDTGLIGLRDYYYRLVAVNMAGVMSEASEIQRARPQEIAELEPPSFTLERINLSPTEDLVRIRCEVTTPGSEVMLQYQPAGARLWRTLSDWASGRSTHLFDHSVGIDDTINYRIWSRTPSKQLSGEPEALTSWPLP